MPDTLRMAGALVPGHSHREQDLLDVSHESLVGVSGDPHHPRRPGPPRPARARRSRAAVDTAPSGGNLVVEVNHSTNRSSWTVVGTVTIGSGQNTGSTELSAGTLAAGWSRLDINTGNGAPADLTVIFVCKQPLTAS